MVATMTMLMSVAQSVVRSLDDDDGDVVVGETQVGPCGCCLLMLATMRMTMATFIFMFYYISMILYSIVLFAFI